MDTLNLTEAPPALGESPEPSQAYASIHAMAAWATLQMGMRQPDVVITHPGADVPYLLRWYVIPRNEHANIYLHRFLRSDDDRALHDHPWQNCRWLLEGEYREHTPEGVFHRRPGDIVDRGATSSHRIELIGGQPVTSLFFTGPKEREWGFHCPQGWVHWQIFLGSYDGSAAGQGCGA